MYNRDVLDALHNAIYSDKYMVKTNHAAIIPDLGVGFTGKSDVGGGIIEHTFMELGDYMLSIYEMSQIVKNGFTLILRDMYKVPFIYEIIMCHIGVLNESRVSMHGTQKHTQVDIDIDDFNRGMYELNVTTISEYMNLRGGSSKLKTSNKKSILNRVTMSETIAASKNVKVLKESAYKGLNKGNAVSISSATGSMRDLYAR